MKLTKEEKETILLSSEADVKWLVYTFNAGLKRKLATFADKYPKLCSLKDKDNESGSVTYEIQKARVSIRLTAPYSDERRTAASEYARAHGINSKEKTGKER